MSYQFNYDEEAVIREADIEQAHMVARGNYLARLERNGVCTHNSVVGVSASGDILYPEQEGLEGDQKRCCGCGTVFNSAGDWVRAMQNL